MPHFTLGQESHHRAGDPQCPACSEEYPAPCPCGGFIHAAADEADADGNVLVATRCDRCARSEDELAEPRPFE